MGAAQGHLQECVTGCWETLTLHVQEYSIRFRQHVMQGNRCCICGSLAYESLWYIRAGPRDQWTHFKLICAEVRLSFLLGWILPYNTILRRTWHCLQMLWDFVKSIGAMARGFIHQGTGSRDLISRLNTLQVSSRRKRKWTYQLIQTFGSHCRVTGHQDQPAAVGLGLFSAATMATSFASSLLQPATSFFFSPVISAASASRLEAWGVQSDGHGKCWDLLRSGIDEHGWTSRS